MWHAMWNDVEPVGSHAKGAFHFGCRGLRHHDRRPGDIDKLGQDRPLSRRRSRWHIVERRHHRHFEGPNEVEDVRALLAAPDAVSMLNADHLHAAVVEGVCDIRVVRLVVAPDSMTDLGRIRPDLVGRMEGPDLPLADRSGQIVRERGNPALARGIGGDEGRPRDEVTPVRFADRWLRPLGVTPENGSPLGAVLATRRATAGAPVALRPEAINARAASLVGGLGCANLDGARALGARLDFERDTLAAD